MSDNVIIGIDPGTRVTGFGIIRVSNKKLSVIDYGCIRPPASLPLNDRYLALHKGIEHLLEKHPVQGLVIETQYVDIRKSPQSALKVGMARGVIILAARKRDIPIPVFEYPPSVAKLSVTGTGQASKEHVQKMVQKILSLSKVPTPIDAADALCLAICHISRNKFSL